MDDRINQITGQIIRRLPGGRDHYRLDELRGMEFPDFLIERIGVELKRNLRKSLDFPPTKWARMESPEVQEKWKEFIGVARKMISLPADEMRPVVRTCVEECLKILVQPRRNIPELLYGNDLQLPYGEVIQRLEAVVVYPHFARLLPRYMQKKEIRMLERERCEQIIRASDAKMTEQYGAEEWAALLQPLFELMNGSVDAGLVRLFFEDKGMTTTAARFTGVDGTLNRPMLIRILSDADEPDQIAEAPDDRDSSETDRSGKTDRAKESPAENDFSAEWNRSMEERWPGDAAEDAPEEPERSGEEGPERPAAEVDSDDPPRQPAAESDSDNNEPAAESDRDGEAAADSGSDDEEPQETPMWMRFMSPEQRAELEREEELRREEAIEEGDAVFGITEEPAAVQPEPDRPVPPQPENPRATPRQETTGQKDPEPAAMEKHPEPVRPKAEPAAPDVSEEAEKKDTDTDEEAYREELMALQRVMSDEREAFIADLFGDSEEDFSEALKDIAGMDNWRSVSRYMQDNIFQQNLVEMYSEAAVEFTDRLQAFFLKKQHSK